VGIRTPLLLLATPTNLANPGLAGSLYDLHSPQFAATVAGVRHARHTEAMRSSTLPATMLAIFVSACGGASSPSTTALVVSVTTATYEGVSMELSSPAFSPSGPIPARYTCDGADVSPELRVEGIPEGAAALVLIMDDPDASGRTWDHWVAYDIEPVERIQQDVGNVGTGGVNSWKTTGYGGPCPPSGTHRYFFKVLALDAVLDLGEGEDKATVLAATVGHVLAEATLMGTYAR